MQIKATIGIHAKIKYQIKVINACTKYFKQKMYVSQCFLSHGQQPCKSIESKEGFYIRIRFNTHRNRLGLHQHDRCFVVIGGREVTRKLSASEA